MQLYGRKECLSAKCLQKDIDNESIHNLLDNHPVNRYPSKSITGGGGVAEMWRKLTSKLALPALSLPS